MNILYDSTGAPVYGDKVGPKPGSFGLVKGWPETTFVLGVVDTSQTMLYGTLHEITAVVGKTTTAITAVTTAGTPGSDTAQLWTFDGTNYVVSAPVQSFTARNFSGAASTTSDLFGFTERGGSMCLDSALGGSAILRGTLGAALSNATTGVAINGVSATTSATNPMGYAGSSGDSVYVANVSGAWEVINVQQHVVTMVADSLIDAPNKKLQKKTQDLVVMVNSTASAAQDIDTGSVCSS